MPIYEYVCLSCGRRIDVIHGINGTGPEACATCGGAMKKALTTPAIHFKGSGWAKKDAKSSAAPVAASAVKSDDAPAAAAPASTESGGSEPAAAPAPVPAATPAPATGTSGS